MKDVRFLFLGKTYKAFVDVSPKDNPHRYWIFLEDPDLCEELGHCIAFTRTHGSELLLATAGLHQHQGLIRAVKRAVEQCLHSWGITRTPAVQYAPPAGSEVPESFAVALFPAPPFPSCTACRTGLQGGTCFNRVTSRAISCRISSFT